MKLAYLLLLLTFIISCELENINQITIGLGAQVNTEIGKRDFPEKVENWERIMHRDTEANDMFPTIPIQHYDSIFGYNRQYFTDGFDYPVGIPNANGYFKAQNFGDHQHLGEDWNAISGGNTDLGDPVHVIANGLVTFSKDVCCGWGNVIRIVHYLPDNPDTPFVESVYAHLHNRRVKAGDLVMRGEKIGSIGTANGRYMAHLHLELRSFINMSLGPGYSKDVFGFFDPSDFIDKNRPK